MEVATWEDEVVETASEVQREEVPLCQADSGEEEVEVAEVVLRSEREWTI